MKAYLIRPLMLGVFAFPLLVAAFPLLVAAQQGVGSRQDPAIAGNNFFSNVPINELSAKAYRRFHRLFREIPTGEYWFKYDQGYKVSFTLDQHHEFAYFGVNGAFLYSLRYFDGRELSKDLTDLVKRRFPDFKIDVVTEVNNGQGTFYLLQIMNADHIKMLTIADGRIDVVTDMANGSANIGPAEAAR